MIKKVLGAVAALAFTTGCSSIATFHTADTVKKGESRHTIALGQMTVDVSDVSGVKIDSSDQSEDTISVPMTEYMFRYGLTDAIDFGFRTTGLVLGGDIKWKFLDNGTFRMATGLGFNYFSYTTATLSEETKVTLTDLFVPIFMDYDFSDDLTFYLVPKYMMRGANLETSVTAAGGTASSDSDSLNFMGASIGLKWGKEKGVMVEYTLMTAKLDEVVAGQDDTLNINQVGIGFFW